MKGESTLKKKFKMEELDCAHCAEKIERAVAKIPGVNEVSVNFEMQKISIDADDDRFEEILDQAQAVCDKVDAGTRIVR